MRCLYVRARKRTGAGPYASLPPTFAGWPAIACLASPSASPSASFASAA